MFDFGMGSTIISVVTAIMTGLGIIILLGSKTTVSRTFVFALTTALVWSCVMIILVAIPEKETSLGNFVNKLSYITGLFVALSFLYFCLVFTTNKKLTWWVPFSITMLGFCSTLMLLYTDILFGDGKWKGYAQSMGVHIWGADPGRIPFLYDILFVAIFTTGIVFIYKKMKSSKDPKEKTQLKFMFWTITVGFVPPSIVSIILPSLGTFQYDWIGPTSSLLWIFIVAYSIIKAEQMNVRMVLIEVLVLAGLLLLFVNIFL